MNDRMTESEEKVVRSVLKTELFCAGQLRAQAGCATLSPYVVCLNREERQYGIAFNGKVVKVRYKVGVDLASTVSSPLGSKAF